MSNEVEQKQEFTRIELLMIERGQYLMAKRLFKATGKPPPNSDCGAEWYAEQVEETLANA